MIQILVVDDFAPFRQSISKLLSKASSMELTGEAATGREGVQMAEQLQPQIILLDLSLPDLNGIDAAACIERVAPDSKIVFVTVDSSPSMVEAARSTGAVGYLLKAQVHSKLLPALVAILRGEQVWPENGER